MGPIWPSYFEECSSVIVRLHVINNNNFKKLHPWSFFKSFCAHFHSSWWTRATLLRYLRPVSSYWLCSQQSCCTPSLCLFCSTRGETIISDTYFYICKPVFWPPNTNIIKILPCKHLISLCICRLMVFHFFRDMPCPMSLVEMKSLIRMEEIIASAPQPITVLEVSAHTGQGLMEVLDWLESITSKWTTWSVLQVPYEALKPRRVPAASLVCRDCSYTVEVVFNDAVTGCDEKIARNTVVPLAHG